MFSWFRKRKPPSPSLPDLADWERTCPDCGTPDGQLHSLYCLKERCPFCGGQLATCDCIDDVLHLSSEERQARETCIDDTIEPLRSIMQRWESALQAKGRIPFRASPLPATVDSLILAAVRGELPFVRALLARGVPVDAANEVGFTPLMAAARNHQLDVLQHLLNAGARIPLRTHEGFTALHCAVSTPTAGSESGHTPPAAFLKELHRQAAAQQTSCVRLLLQSGAEVDVVDNNGRTPLMGAAWFGCVESVTLLLEAGADVTRKDNRGRTARQLAEERGHAETARVLGSRE